MTFKTGQQESVGLFSSWPRGNAGNCLLFTTWVLPSVCIYSATTINCRLTNVFCCPFVMMRCAFMRWDHYHEKCKVNIQVDQRAVKMMTQSTEVKMYDHVRYTCVCMRIMGTPRECECTCVFVSSDLRPVRAQSLMFSRHKPRLYAPKLSPSLSRHHLFASCCCTFMLSFWITFYNPTMPSVEIDIGERERWLILFYL